MLELKHLKTMLALERGGNLVSASALLFMSHSALSHQLKELESRIGERLFERKTEPLRFTESGLMLLNLAREVIPRVTKVEAELKGGIDRVEELRIGIECHACFQWLLPAITEFNQRYADIRVDLQGENLFDGVTELERQSLDLLFTDDRVALDDLEYETLGEFELVLVMGLNDALASRHYIQPEDLKSRRLLTYPVPLAKLDVFRQFLQPAMCQPQSVKTVANSSVMLQMVAAGLGVAAVPDWLVKDFDRQQLLCIRPLGPKGLNKTLYGAYQAANRDKVQDFLPVVRRSFEALLTSRHQNPID
ncbi:LysR substrate-binding domain-containing protein [Lacimicrobium alkaliphilum]|uniref:LysR family transcriptional regulator n=1 Tax=Lacimicrobium alkaliphilum TaxID=1526571 RepID=A0ABQ1QWM8_9ALTE|nr:LysR substrate-binding domain-containing protein [Lacimicrobium alkaliphilum]GGD50104.1 LysR family transcriptional regulator [Lacimicrobium alkaliphilum]